LVVCEFLNVAFVFLLTANGIWTWTYVFLDFWIFLIEIANAYEGETLILISCVILNVVTWSVTFLTLTEICVF
jgi:hypothetical protein